MGTYPPLLLLLLCQFQCRLAIDTNISERHISWGGGGGGGGVYKPDKTKYFYIYCGVSL